MWTAFFSALAAIPKLLEMVENFSLWIIEQVYLAKEKRLSDDLEKALSKAKEEKDTSGLDDIFSGK